MQKTTEFVAMFQVENGLKDCIGPSPLKIAFKKISNGMWKSINGSLGSKVIDSRSKNLEVLRNRTNFGISKQRSKPNFRTEKQAEFRNFGTLEGRSLSHSEVGQISNP